MSAQPIYSVVPYGYNVVTFKKEHIYEARDIMIARVLNILIIFFSTINSFSYAQEVANPIRQFSIGNEISRHDRVLVCRPEPGNTEIARIAAHNNLKTLEDYSNWLNKRITYKSDNTTTDWVDWATTMQRGYADCKGYTQMNYSFLKVLGYKPQIFILKGLLNMHAVCVCKGDSGYIWFDNSKIRSSREQTLDGFLEYLSGVTNCSAILEIDQTSRTVSKRISIQPKQGHAIRANRNDNCILVATRVGRSA